MKRTAKTPERGTCIVVPSFMSVDAALRKSLSRRLNDLHLPHGRELESLLKAQAHER